MQSSFNNLSDLSRNVLSIISKNSKNNFYFIYGNHGDFPIQQEDYFLLLRDFLNYCIGKPLFASETPVSGHWNILFENFKKKAVDEIKKIKINDLETHFICIATEFKTGNTFNSFSTKSINSLDIDQNVSTYKIKFLFLNILDGFLRHSGIINFTKKLPFYSFFKNIYQKIMFKTLGNTHYSNSIYWKKRYDSFIEALPYFDQVWTINPNQQEGFRSILEPNKLWHLPIIPYIDEITEPSLKFNNQDIDFLFTGTMTAYRLQIMNELRMKGFNTVFGLFPSFLRQSYLEQTKICLHIKPYKNWSFVSNMRLHTLLMAGKYVISEACSEGDEKTIQQKFVEEVASDQFVEVVTKRITDPNLKKLGYKAREDYIKKTQNLRFQVREQIRQSRSKVEKPMEHQI